MAQHYAVFNPLFRRYYQFFPPRRHIETGISGADRKSAFERYYQENRWSSGESRSGRGSELQYTIPVRAGLQRLLKKYEIRSILDAPCGDYNWMRYVDLPAGCRYVGCDIVGDLVRDLSQRFGDETHSFATLDIVDGDIPDVDLWLCRDVLFHLTQRDGLEVLRQASRAPVRYFLSSTHDLATENVDVNTAGFRPINLCLPPYSLPRPLDRIDDFVAPGIPRSLALWSADQLAELARR